MNLGTRISIVTLTLGTCLLAAHLQHRERDSDGTRAPALLFDTIQGQISALRAQRYQEAYLKASRQYMDSTDLEQFIQRARGMESVPRQAVRWEFGIPFSTEDSADVPVHFFLPGGESVPAIYTLIREKRLWKIDGVQMLESVSPRAAVGVRL